MAKETHNCANCHWLEADYEDASDGHWMARTRDL